MKHLKKAISTLLIASTLSFTSLAKPAQAGVIFTPILLGIVLLVIGIEDHDVLLIVLDADGNLPQSSLEQTLAKRYPAVDDGDVIHDLAAAIRAKAVNTPVVDGKKNVTLDRDEVLSILAPTGLQELQPAVADRIVADLGT